MRSPIPASICKASRGCMIAVLCLLPFGCGLSGQEASGPGTTEEVNTSGIFTEERTFSCDENGVTLWEEFGDTSLNEVVRNGEIYHDVDLQGCRTTMDEGAPRIPTRTLLVAVPDDVELRLEILETSRTTRTGCRIAPAARIVPGRTVGGLECMEEEFCRDEVLYARDGLVPPSPAVVSGISHIRDQRVARVEFHPVQFNPARGELVVHTTIRVRLHFSCPAALEKAQVGPFRTILESSVLNYSSLPERARVPGMKRILTSGSETSGRGAVTYPGVLSAVHEADYLIITSDGFFNDAKADHENGPPHENALNALANWRSEYNGYHVAVVSVSDPFIGGNTDTNIKTFIEYVYGNWNAPNMDDNHVGYILLAGDTDCVASHYVRENTVADRWFGCIGDEDFTSPDVMIGRFCVDDYAELSSIAGKTIQYEGNPDTGNWRGKLLMGEGTSGPCLPDYVKEKEELLERNGFEVSEVFVSNGGNWQDFRDQVNEGRWIANVSAHGWLDGWEAPLFQSTHIDSLYNEGRFPLVLSCSCGTARFQDSDDCFGERMVNGENKGAIAFWGASENTFNVSNVFASAMFEKISCQYEYVLGKLVNACLIDLGSWFNFHEYNLLGDPALDLSGAGNFQDLPDPATNSSNVTVSAAGPLDLEIEAVIDNIGGASVAGLPVRFFRIDTGGNRHFIGDVILDEIAAGGSGTAVKTCHISGIDEFQIRFAVVIDPDSTVAEAYEYNNEGGGEIELPLCGSEFQSVRIRPHNTTRRFMAISWSG